MKLTNILFVCLALATCICMLNAEHPKDAKIHNIKDNKEFAQLWGIIVFAVEGLDANTGLSAAAIADNLEKVKASLNRGANANFKDADRIAPLHAATLWENKPMVEILLKNGANINMQDPDYDDAAPLHIAAALGNVKLMQLLIAQGARKDMKNKSGHTALMLAAYFNHIDAVRYLLDKKVNINLKDVDGHTALDYAKESHNNAIIDLLKSRGAR